MKPSSSLPFVLLNSRWLPLAAVVGALGAGWLVGQSGLPGSAAMLLAPLLVALVLLIFYYPRLGFIAFISYCFAIMVLARHIPNIPFGLGMEALLLLTWLAVVFHQSGRYSWRLLRNDLCKLTLAWFILNVLELGNPAGASPVGWFFEMRGTTLYWLLTVPLAFLLFNSRRDLRHFLGLIIGLSVLGSLYGIKQHVLGVDNMEQAWLNAGAYRTHVLWGQLRIFSTYSEAAQFGSSQGHIGLICLILALGPYATWKRVLLGCAALLLFYGMLISGTRGALVVVVVGSFIYLALSKKVKVLLIGTLLAATALGMLKYTYIGNGNADIVRLRTSLNPNEPSLQIRLQNQVVLREYLASRPLGGGVGSIGMWGITYNPGNFLSTIAPDSYYVKVWAEYGIIGFLIWLGISLYILGKCCGIVWNIRDPGLRQQLLALTAGYGGILVCSYGNEIMNQMPSAMIIYISWVFVFLGPKLDQPKPLLMHHA